MAGVGHMDGGDILFYAGITLAVFIILLFLKKVFFRFWLQQNFLMFPSLNINVISSIAMIIATNTAVIFTITFLTHNLLGIVFQIYPGSRLLIETILIKIGGSLYGPVIGMLIGLLTDLLTVVLTSSVFNYGYLLAAIFNGFLGGFIYMFGDSDSAKNKLKSWQNAFCVTALLGITAIAYYFFNESALMAEKKGDQGKVSLNIFSQTLTFPSWFFPSFLAGIGGILLIALGACLLLSNKRISPKIVEKADKWNVIIRLTILNFIAYVLVDIITLPLFDIKISTLPFEQFFIMRNFFLIPSVVFSSLIIWKIFKLNRKLQFTTIKNKLPLPKKKKVVKLCSNLHPNLVY
ncbi:glutamyl-tRNA amidotransferase [Mycoplasma wenyonii]|uniref:Glutamyl-tRNA amidotransferase n=1 Tax=Mycoplasma wenyonii TaxID=65123 RepID=A0A328PV76_9MOLU|nr:glutamyl-tRNA amidotransferase [Mycoplasma wenyonii]RAO95341.1 glutamyl-tRNA amidotransferase [Mycoplasma wenyonii]